MKFTWIGGATFLLELGAFRILGDPVFGDGFDMVPDRPVTRAGALPSVDIAELDAVCVSNFRPDHFDSGTAARVGGNPALISPPVVGADHGFSDARMLVHWASIELAKGDEKLVIHATPACGGNGYYFSHTAAGNTTTVFWTGDALWSDDTRRVQRDLGHANLLIVHLGAETDEAGAPLSPAGKEAMQIVYRMQPNAIAAIHHHTFSHYAEDIGPFVELIGKTIYEKRLRVLLEGESFEK
jgi:L-ascorbate metabolism protein UlaG (beta-lactamase superfamily)